MAMNASTPSSPDDALQVRLVSAVIFLACLGLLSVAAWLNPSGGGVGTHEQMGLPPCGLLATTGLPCATCGMTTSFALAADGRIIASFINQPMGALLAIITAVAVTGSGLSLLTGVSAWPVVSWLCRPWFFILMGILAAGAWGYKIIMVTGMGY